MKLWAITIKDLNILLRDQGAMVTLFLMPLTFIVVMSLALAPAFRGDNGGISIHLPVADLDGGAKARKVLDTLKDIKGINVEAQVSGGSQMTREQAEEAVRSGKRVAAVIIPRGFSNDLKRGAKTRLILVVDPAQANVVGIIEGVVRGVAERVGTETSLSRGVDALLDPVEGMTANLPAATREEILREFNSESIKTQIADEAKKREKDPLIAIERQDATGIKREKLPGVYEQNVPGYTVMFLFFIVTRVAESILSEKREGTFRRLLVAPIARATILAGKLLPNYLVGLAQVTVMFSIGHFVFGMSLGNSFAGLVLLTLAVSAAATSLGMLVAALARTEAQVGGIATLAILVLAALGGTMVPLFIMPDFMQTLAQITPHAWAMTGYQNLIVRGYGLAEVLPQVGVLLAFTTLFFGIAVWRFRFQ